MNFDPSQVLCCFVIVIQDGGMGRVRVGYPSDVTDEEWALVLPYLLLCREDSPHREHDLCEVFNGLRFIAKTGCQWRRMPNDLPPLGGSLPAHEAMDGGGLFRGSGGRRAADCTRVEV